MSGLRTSQLVKTYGATTAVAGIDLDVPAGSVYGLVGPNGSGKTTTLEMLAGLRRPTAGTIELGVDRSLAAYCPDTPEFEPWLTAREVLGSAAGLLRRPASSDRVDALLERVGLAHAADRRVGGFSRGMQSRLGLAAGLVGEPRLLLADEPAAALDPAGQREVVDLLAELAGSMTVLVSSHDLLEVQRVCTHVGIMSGGRLAYQGTLDDLLAMAPDQLRVVVRPPADALLAKLDACDWVRSVEQHEPGHLTVTVTDPARAESALPQLLASTSSRLVEVGRVGATLEDVFFQLTGTGPHRAASKDHA